MMAAVVIWVLSFSPGCGLIGNLEAIWTRTFQYLWRQDINFFCITELSREDIPQHLARKKESQVLSPCYTKCGPLSSSSTTGELVRNTDYQAPLWTCWIWSYVLQNPRVMWMHAKVWEALGQSDSNWTVRVNIYFVMHLTLRISKALFPLGCELYEDRTLDFFSLPYPWAKNSAWLVASECMNYLSSWRSPNNRMQSLIARRNWGLRIQITQQFSLLFYKEWVVKRGLRLKSMYLQTQVLSDKLLSK